MALPDKEWLNQYDPALLALVIHVNGVPADPDANAVTVTMTNLETGVDLFARPATRAAVGSYEIQLNAGDTAEPGEYKLRWDYDVGGNADYYETQIQVGQFSPDYAALNDDMRGIVEQTWNRFEDLFDSPYGGPNLQTYFQSHFNRGRMAQLLVLAVGRLNTVAQPYQTYTLDGVNGPVFPVTKWGALLERALYVETLKHLKRSYVEQPDLRGGEVTYHDRRDYLDRWGVILDDEEQDLKSQLDTFKISNMMLGRPAVLVSGGVYGRFGPTRYAGSAAARPRYAYARFY
jgi:hypothetical protein